MTPPSACTASPRCATMPRAVVLGALLARATGAPVVAVAAHVHEVRVRFEE